MNRITWSRILFGLAALYDAVLGVAFLVDPEGILRRFEIEPPHLGYLRFPAALLIVFAVMFAAIARHPAANRGLIPYGMGLKIAYCAVAFGYWFGPGIPWIWQPFAIIDLIMLGLFVWAYAALGATGRPPVAPPGG